MSKINFWDAPLTKLIAQVEDFLNHNPKGKHIAAFDADGTCWFNDVGRDFYLHQCNTVFKDRWRWEDYTERERQDVGESLWWLAEINQGVGTVELVQQASQALQIQGQLQLIPSQQHLIEFLNSKGVEVFIVTASIKWSILPAAETLKIDADHVLGVTTMLDAEGRLTLNRKEPITWREGKPKALLEATQGISPFLCSGNTTSDLPLLESASHFRISINSVDEQDSIFVSEQKLKAISEERRWLHFDYLNQK